MDFNKLEVVKTANPQMKPYDLEIVDPKTGYFLVTEKAMLEFEFHLNGMTQINDENAVYIGITDSEKSVFFKNSVKGETKFRRFKNINLMAQLMAITVGVGIIKGDRFIFDFVEDYKHYKMYLLRKYVPGTDVLSSDAPASEEATPEVEKKQEVAEEPILKEEIAKAPDTAGEEEEKPIIDIY
jgi:hypothetical protein